MEVIFLKKYNKKILPLLLCFLIIGTLVFFSYDVNNVKAINSQTYDGMGADAPIQVFDGYDELNVFMTSDWHYGDGHASTCINDLNNNLDCHVIINNGDMVDQPASDWDNFHVAWDAANGTNESNLIYKNYVHGNHEGQFWDTNTNSVTINWANYSRLCPSGRRGDWTWINENRWGPNYTAQIGNLLFVAYGVWDYDWFDGGKGHLMNDHTDNGEGWLNWFNQTIQNNQDKNIIVVPHIPVYDTVASSTTVYDYWKESDDLIWIMENYNIALWVSGHTHNSHSTSNMIVEKYGTCHVNLGDNKNHYESRMFYFEEGSDEVLIRSRNHDSQSWQSSYDYTATLDFAYISDALGDYKESTTNRFVILPDLLYLNDALNITLRQITDNLSVQPDFLACVGDVIPSDSYDFGTTVEIIENFGFTTNSSDYNFMTILGNHDHPPSGTSYFQNNLAPYYPSINSPDYCNETYPGTCWSFDYGNFAHIIFTNQYWNYSDGGYIQDQLDWIESELASNTNRQCFVFGHEPAYPANRHVGDSLDIDTDMRDDFWDILVKYNARFYACGHTHYTRCYEHDGILESGNCTQVNAGSLMRYGASENDIMSFVVVDVNSDNTTDVRLYESYENGDFYEFTSSFASTYHSDDDNGNVFSPLFLGISNYSSSNVSIQNINHVDNGTVFNETIYLFNWTNESISGKNYYKLQVANDSGFTDVFLDIMVNESVYASNYSEKDEYVEFTLPDNLRWDWYGSFYSRVRVATYSNG